MHYRGINYDTGTKTLTGKLTREFFDLKIIEKEIQIIKNELRCNAIRISGFIIERIKQTSEIALQGGLTVYFSPSLQYDNIENTRTFILDNAQAAEELRNQYSNVIFVAGCELTTFTSGFVNGKTGLDRVKNIFSPVSILKNTIGIKRKYNSRLNNFFTGLVPEIRKIFHGQISYASGTWEKVDWKLFDIIGIDFYRSSFNKSTYIKALKNYQQLGKPVSVMEFGCCAYVGADEKGAMGWAIVDWTKTKPELKGNYIRDEEVQSKYIIELLNIFESENVFASLIFTFISGNYFFDDDPKYDLDLAAFGIVRVLGNGMTGYENLPWVPKKAFFAIAEFNNRDEKSSSSFRSLS